MPRVIKGLLPLLHLVFCLKSLLLASLFELLEAVCQTFVKKRATVWLVYD